MSASSELEELRRENTRFQELYLSAVTGKAVRIAAVQTDNIPIHRKRSRREFEDGAMPQESEGVMQELRVSLARARNQLAAEKILPQRVFAYAVQIPAALRPQQQAKASAASQTDGTDEPRGEREELLNELRATERARRDCMWRRTGVFCALVAGDEEEPAPAALSDDVLLRVFELIVERGEAAGALLEAHRFLCSAMRVSRRWRRLASHPCLWSTFHLRVHALQLPWSSHALAVLPRFASLSHLSLDVVVGDGGGRRINTRVDEEATRSLAALSGPNGDGTGPPPLPSVRSLNLRIFTTDRSFLVVEPVPGLASASARGGCPHGQQLLPWIPACTQAELEVAVGPRPCDPGTMVFSHTVAQLRVADRFPGLRRLSLPVAGYRAGYACAPAVAVRLGAASSGVERLDVHVPLGSVHARDITAFRHAFPRLRHLGGASARGAQGLEQVLALLAPRDEPAAGPSAPSAPAPHAELGTLELICVGFDEEASRRLLRSCLERARPRALRLTACAAPRRLGASLGPSVQALSLGPGTLARLQPEDLPWLAVAKARPRYDPGAARRLGEAAAVLPGLRRLVVRGTRGAGAGAGSALLGGAAHLAALRAGRGLGPLEISEERGFAGAGAAAAGEAWPERPPGAPFLVARPRPAHPVIDLDAYDGDGPLLGILDDAFIEAVVDLEPDDPFMVALNLDL
eukprot:tig00021043_g17613.t1